MLQVERLQREKDASEVDTARLQRDLSVAAAKRRSFNSKLAQVERLDAARDRTLSMIQSARALNPSVSFALAPRASDAAAPTSRSAGGGGELEPPLGSRTLPLSLSMHAGREAPGAAVESTQSRATRVAQSLSGSVGGAGTRALRAVQTMAAQRQAGSVPGLSEPRTSL